MAERNDHDQLLEVVGRRNALQDSSTTVYDLNADNYGELFRTASSGLRTMRMEVQAATPIPLAAAVNFTQLPPSSHQTLAETPTSNKSKRYFQTSTGVSRDLTSVFKRYREKMIKNQREEAEGVLCRGLTYTPAKCKAMEKEVDRLIGGFTANKGFITNLFAEIIPPPWQKSPNWVNPDGIKKCYHCNNQFSLLRSKVNCRIGGQVFCKECCKGEIVIYTEDKNGAPKWTINGKADNKTKPARFEVYSICVTCSSNLEKILLEKRDLESRRSTFMERASKIQHRISTLQGKVDNWLPKYQQAVDTLSGIGIKAVYATDKKKLAKLHFDLSDALSTIEQQCDDELLQLQADNEPSIHVKVYRHILLGAFLRHKQQRHLYSRSRSKFDEGFCSQVIALHEMQKAANRMSLEDVYIKTRQLKDDVRSCMKRFTLDCFLLDGLTRSVATIDEELVPYRTDSGGSWEERVDLAMRSRSPQIEVNGTAESIQSQRYIVFSICSTVIQECILSLSTESCDQEFPRTKTQLMEIYERLETELLQFNTNSASVMNSPA